MFGNALMFTRLIIKGSAAVGAPIPPAIPEALTRAEQIRDNAHFTVARDAMPKAVMAAMADGRDPGTDPEVQRLVTIAGLGDLTTELHGRADAMLADELAANADDLIASLQTTFEQWEAALTAAADRLGNVDLADAQAVLGQGGEAAAMWQQGNTANINLREIAGVWRALALATRFADPSQHYRVLLLAEPTLAQWREHRLRESNIDAWGLHRLGIPLSLPSRTGYTDRINALEVARAVEQRAGEHSASGKIPGLQQHVAMVNAARFLE